MPDRERSDGRGDGDGDGTALPALAATVAGVVVLVGALVVLGVGPFDGDRAADPRSPAVGPTTGPGSTQSAATGTPTGPTTPTATRSPTTAPTPTRTSPPTPTRRSATPTTGGSRTTRATTGTSTPTTTTTTVDRLPPGEPLDGVERLGDAAVAIAGEGRDEFGFGAAVGDLNGDGRPDLAVGAPFHNASGTRSGAVAVFLGPVDPGSRSVGDADLLLGGEAGGDWAGNALAAADLDADGVDDLVVGAPRHGETGAVYVLYGGDLPSGRTSLAAADRVLAGADDGSLSGYSLAVGDVLAGAGADLVVGAPRAGDSRGAVYLLDGDPLPDSLAGARAVYRGESAGDEAGWSVAAVGDPDGQRTAVAVGARRNDDAGSNAGAAYVLRAPFEGGSLADASAVLRGPGAGAFAGWSVDGAGDVDGDGTAELLVGAPLAGAGGVAYLADAGSGRASPASASERSLADATALRAAGTGDRAGWVVAGPGDVTCDGRPDLLVGAPRNDAGGGNAGAAYLVAGTNATATGDGDGNASGAESDLPVAGGSLANASTAFLGSAGDRVGRADALPVAVGDGTAAFVVGAPFGDVPATAHVVYAACRRSPGSG